MNVTLSLMDFLATINLIFYKHQNCLSKCFQQCEKFGISINAAKSEFVVPCGRLVGHIVSNKGIGVDPDKVAAIRKLEIPEHMTTLKGFL